MNPFMAAGTALYVAAGMWALLKGGKWEFAGIYWAYALANVFVILAERRGA